MFYLYAIPTGALFTQIRLFRDLTEQEFGRNRAHDYPVHCTLTRGFAIDDSVLVEDYRDAITRHFAGTLAPKVGKLTHISDRQLVLLELQAPDLALSTLSWVDEFGRSDIVPITENFHITIAWRTEFHIRIFELAQASIDSSVPTSWEVTLCERSDGAKGEPVLPDRWNVPKGLPLC